MGIETQIGWMLICILASAMSFYSLGYNAGKKDGYIKGRSAGMRIGKDRQVSQ